MGTSSNNDLGLPDRKRVLLETLLREEGLNSARFARIGPRPSSKVIPLSFAQERLWFLDQLEPNTSLYTISGAICLDGHLDKSAFENAFHEIVRRHEVLRTTFPSVNGEPRQQINPVPKLLFPVVDLQHLPPAEQHGELRRIVRENADKPFDLENDLLFRIALLKLAENKHVFLLNVHHIVADDWSFGVLHRELAALYSAFARNTSPSLPELPIQYADFSYWQKEWLTGDLLESEIAYWKNQLAGAPAVLELPVDRPRPPVQTFKGSTVSFAVSRELLGKLQTLARKEDVTLFMLLLAAFQALLHRYSQQEDVVVGSPVANRTRLEIENLIGCFVNTLVLRTGFLGDPTFRELLRRVREIALGAYAHQDLPFETLVQELRPERSLSYSPLFQVMFVLQNPSLAELDLDGLSARYLEVERTSAKFDLSLYMYETKEGLQGLLEYNTDLFDASTIERLQRHFQTVLEEVARDPDQRVDELPLLMQSEWQEMLAKWNNTTVVDAENDRCVHQLIEEQAQREPGRVALIVEQQQLTYGELNSRANQVAHHLRKLGVKPDVLVGLFVERSVAMVVGLLGILKAGGAYLPIDPEYPPERVAFMLEDANLNVLLTQRRLASRLIRRSENVVLLDDDWEQIALEDTRNPPNVVNTDNLAYTIYTSGSTGKPKGVQIEHGSLMNFLLSMKREPGLTQDDVLLAVTTLCFDIAGLEIYLPLISGARLLLASYWVARDGTMLLDLMRRSGTTVMQATPSTWGLLIEAGWDGAAPLKVLCGGEAMPPELSKKLTQRSRSVWNVYGPTETTIWSSVYRVTGQEKGAIPIGHPIANTQIYVLDPHLNPVPLNVSGEIYIGGGGVAREYLNRPELTAEKFIPDPFAQMPGGRLYRTGDIGRRLASGDIECLGRVDLQVKIRGFRIELGEIESALGRHPSIKQCVVVAREDAPGDQRLIAYAQKHQGSTVTPDNLRDHLKEALPSYMIPSKFVFMANLPLTPNGKIDRKALPSAGDELLERRSKFVPPRDALEQKLAQLWSRILKVKDVGIYDNFFDLGGHSLAAVRMVAEVRRFSGKNLPLATLFQASTVAAVAEILRNDGWTPSWTSLVPIQALGSRPPLFLVHGAEGNVLLYRRLAQRLGADQPVYGLQSQGLNGNGYRDITVEEMASRYIKEVLALQPQGPYFLGGYCLGGIIAFEMAQQLASSGEKVELVIMLETYNIASLVSKPGESLRSALRSLQNVGFHGLNGLSLGARDGLEFLREKAEVSWGRLGVKVHAFYHALQRLSGRNVENAYPHLAVKRGNDHAADHYVPRPYSGRVVLIRPNRYFLDRRDPHFGWEKLVRGDLEVRELPIYPRAMLMEPFCRSLADTLSSFLNNASSSG